MQKETDKSRLAMLGLGVWNNFLGYALPPGFNGFPPPKLQLYIVVPAEALNALDEG